MTAKLRVLELYSGIGGMHYALKESGVPHEVVMAVDINTTANSIYTHNFPATQLHSFGIEKLTLKRLEGLNIDAILMSPPCQPFTRVGKKRDVDDVRTKSFLHVMTLLRQLTRKVEYLLVENVQGFETSQTHQLLLTCMKECGYSFQQFLLTPLQFGIPNCRLRYYMIASLTRPLPFDVQDTLMRELPLEGNRPEEKLSDADVRLQSPEHGCMSGASEGCVQSDRDCPEILSSDQSKTVINSCEKDKHNSSNSEPNQFSTNQCNSDQPGVSGSCDRNSNNSSAKGAHLCNSAEPGKNDNNSSKLNVVHDFLNISSQHLEDLKEAGRNMRYCETEERHVTSHSRPLGHFMEQGVEEYFRPFLLGDKDLRLFVVMDMVFPQLKKSTCFTKRYGHYVEGAGSVVQMTHDVEAVRAASAFKTLAVEKNNRREWGEVEMEILQGLRLRYFTPREVANLLCFPADFDWPEGMGSVQMYRVLGNSLNVHVVAKLVALMTSNKQNER